MSDEVTQNQLKPGKLNNDKLLSKLFYGTPLTHDEIADIFGVSRVAVTNRVNKLGLLRKMKSTAEFEASLSDELMDKIQVVMNQLSADKIQQASLSQLGVLLGILYDKRSQHEKRGLPEVSYVGVVHKFDPDSIKQLKDVISTETQKRLEESRQATLKQLNDE